MNAHTVLSPGSSVKNSVGLDNKRESLPCEGRRRVRRAERPEQERARARARQSGSDLQSRAPFRGSAFPCWRPSGTSALSHEDRRCRRRRSRTVTASGGLTTSWEGRGRPGPSPVLPTPDASVSASAPQGHVPCVLGSNLFRRGG